MFKRLLLKLFLKYEEVFFVGATDKLPPPLSKEEELKYLVLAKSGDNYAKDKLIEHNLRLVVFLAKKYETTANENGNVLIKIKNIDYKNVRLKKCNSICNYILVI